MTVYQRLRLQVLEQLDAERVDPSTDPRRVREVVDDLVAGYQRSADLGTDPRLRDAGEMARRLEDSVVAFGPLTDVLTSAEVEEVFIEGSRVTWMDRTGRLHGLAEPTSEEENRAVVDRLLAPTTRSLDTRNPMVQARVLDGRARLSAAIPPVAEALSATIRRHATRRHDLEGLVATGSLSEGAAALLRLVMGGWSSVVVSGQPGAGKTSLLAALLGAVPPQRCVRVCEEIRELTVPLTHGSYYEARPPSVSGEAEVSLRDLLKFCLGMRSDLIVVGEVRGAEAFGRRPSQARPRLLRDPDGCFLSPRTQYPFSSSPRVSIGDGQTDGGSPLKQKCQEGYCSWPVVGPRPAGTPEPAIWPMASQADSKAGQMGESTLAKGRGARRPSRGRS